MVVTCTGADVDRLIKLYGARPKFTVIPQGFDRKVATVDRAGLRQRTRAALGIMPGDLALVFVGGPGQHNRDAVRFLEREVMPNLSRRACLLVAGDCCKGEPLRMQDGQPVRRLGYIGDLRPLFAAADIGINPVTYGTGSSVKVADYLAAGLPVFTTAVGMRGHESLREWLHVLEPSEFVRALERFEIGARSRCTELPELGWDALGRKLYDAYARLLQLPR
jgi:glycosyltransferase involved in cell wall biosynthesis